MSEAEIASILGALESTQSALSKLEREMALLRQAHDKATSDREQYRALYMQLLERCRLLERGIVAGVNALRFFLVMISHPLYSRLIEGVHWIGAGSVIGEDPGKGGHASGRRFSHGISRRFVTRSRAMPANSAVSPMRAHSEFRVRSMASS